MTQETSMIHPVSFNVNCTSDHSSYSFGTLGTQTTLPQTPPTSNLFSGSNFRARANQFFNLSSYPARTSVQVKYYDTLTGISTDMIVGPCFVLISAATITDFSNKGFKHLDSVRVFPAFNNGQPQPGLPTSLSNTGVHGVCRLLVEH
ncbi:MAG: hypothetical protein JNL60_17185 [Bacteroidia bacterium]|nr:hypothetical protein [Bacteroidia bacterium]